MPVEHWMQFATFAEQRHFIYPSRETYDGIILNANMVAHAPGGIAAFLLEKTNPGIKYLIDPLSHAFQHDPSYISGTSGEVKSSIKALSDAYGEPVSEICGTRPLLPEDLENSEIVESYSERVLDFQYNFLNSYMEQSDSSKYLDSDDAGGPKPSALIAPYFYFTEVTLGVWISAFLACARTSSTIAKEKYKAPLLLSLVISQGLLADEEKLNYLAESVKKIECAGYLIWIDNFDEREASGKELSAFLGFCSGLREDGKQVVNLHGGYFSLLCASELGDNALTGVSHGPEFGESRSVVPVGGGIPIAKYYVPELHQRERYRDALHIFRSAGWLESANVFHQKVCGCQACLGVLDGDSDNFSLFGEGSVKTINRKNGLVRIQYPSTETKIRCLQHYLQCKAREYVAAREASEEVLINELEASLKKYRSIVGLDGVSHLQLWRDTFTGNKN